MEQAMNDVLSKGEQTRKSIVSAAYKLFVDQGFHGTSMRQISEKAEVTLGGIYNHFSSKAEIFEEVIVDYHPVNIVLPLIEKTGGDTIDDFVRHAGHTMFDQLPQRDDFVKLLFIEIVEFNAAHIPKLFVEIFPRILNFAEQMKNRRGALRDTSATVMVVTFMGIIFAFFAFQNIIGRYNPLGFPDIDIDSILDVFLYGIAENQTGEIQK
jgi:AcrR family transcriptional regulator